jgi:hypothetical protein
MMSAQQKPTTSLLIFALLSFASGAAADPANQPGSQTVTTTVTMTTTTRTERTVVTQPATASSPPPPDPAEMARTAVQNFDRVADHVVAQTEEIQARFDRAPCGRSCCASQSGCSSRCSPGHCRCRHRRRH